MERRETGVVNGGKTYGGDVLYFLFYAVFLVFYPVGGVSAAVPDCI